MSCLVAATVYRTAFFVLFFIDVDFVFVLFSLVGVH